MRPHFWKLCLILTSVFVCIWLIDNHYLNDSSVTLAVFFYALVVSVLLLNSLPSLLKGERVGYFILILGSWFYFAYPAVRILMTPGNWFGYRINFPLSNDSIIETTLYLSTFLLVAVGVYWALSQKPDLAQENITALTPDQLYVPLLLLFALVSLPYLILGGGVEETIQGILAARAGAKGWKQTELLGDSISPIWVFSRPSLVTVTAISLLLLLTPQSKLRIRYFYGLLFALTIFVVFFDTGTRSWFLLTIVPPTLVLLRNKMSGISPFKFILGSVIALLIFAAAQFQLRYRTVGDFDKLEISLIDTLSIVDNDFFTETAVAVSVVPKVRDYVQENNFLLFITNPIPRFLWPNKPLPETLYFYSLIRRGYSIWERTGGNSIPSLVGQFYISRGIWGIIGVGVFYGLAYSFFDKQWLIYSGDRYRSLVYATGMIWLWLGHRGLYPGFHYAFVVEAVIIWIAALKSSPTPQKNKITTHPKIDINLSST